MGKNNGNALFLILIAVALFAALSYSVTQSSRAGGNIEREQQMIDTAVDQQCVASVEHGERVLRILNGCDTAELSYELPGGGNENTDAPSDKSCHLFDVMGAGLTPCGGYLEIPESGVTIGSIGFGDTDTVTLMSNGVYFRCDSFGAQGSNYGVCDNWSYSMDGEVFNNDRICVGKDMDEFFARAPAIDELLNLACGASCGGNVGGGNYVINNSGTSPFYFAPDLSLTPYAGACAISFDIIASNFSCNCWGTDG